MGNSPHQAETLLVPSPALQVLPTTAASSGHLPCIRHPGTAGVAPFLAPTAASALSPGLCHHPSSAGTSTPGSTPLCRSMTGVFGATSAGMSPLMLPRELPVVDPGPPAAGASTPPQLDSGLLGSCRQEGWSRQLWAPRCAPRAVPGFPRPPRLAALPSPPLPMQARPCLQPASAAV